MNCQHCQVFADVVRHYCALYVSDLFSVFDVGVPGHRYRVRSYRVRDLQ